MFIKTGAIPEKAERQVTIPTYIRPNVLALPERRFATVDEMERVHPYPIAWYGELNIECRVCNQPLEPASRDATVAGPAVDMDQVSGIFFTFTNARGFADNLHDFEVFVLSQERNMRTAHGWLWSKRDHSTGDWKDHRPHIASH
jgi:hypothetical protein